MSANPSFFKDRAFLIAAAALIAVTSLSITLGSPVTIPNTFVANTRAVAAEVNANFQALATAVNDNDARIATLEAYVRARPATRRLVFPGRDFAYPATSTVITPGYNGLFWKSDYTSAATIWQERPVDYKPGTDATFTILFETSSATAGNAEFFIRPLSFNAGADEVDPPSISSGPVAVSGMGGFGRLYKQQFTIPAADLANEMWLVKVQRQGANSPSNPETYTDQVNFLSATVEYTTQ
jgi:hypothetical protein